MSAEMQRSKMQALVDKARHANMQHNPIEAIEALIQAVELLARAQQQIMSDFDRVQNSRTDIPIRG